MIHLKPFLISTAASLLTLVGAMTALFVRERIGGRKIDWTTFLVVILMALVVIVITSAMVSTTCQGAELNPYARALTEARQTHQSLVVMVGTTGCKPCDEAERLFGAAMRTCGVYVHLDAQADVATLQSLPAVSVFPTVIFWYRDEHGGWASPRCFSGLAKIAEFVREKTIADAAASRGVVKPLEAAKLSHEAEKP